MTRGGDKLFLNARFCGYLCAQREAASGLERQSLISSEPFFVIPLVSITRSKPLLQHQAVS